MITDKDQCPDRENHTPCPTGYLAWSAWAERMSKTHKQVRCKKCGMFAVWEPKLMLSYKGKGRVR